MVLCVECSVLQRTLRGSYCTTGGQWYCGLNGVCYIEYYMEAPHIKWTLVLCEFSALK